MENKKPLQIIMFVIIFVVALVAWNYILVGHNNQSVRERSQASLPLLSLVVDGESVNEMHGYKGKTEASVIRDSITPLYDSKVQVKLNTTSTKLDAVSYRLYDTDNKTVLEKGDAAFKESKKQYLADVNIAKRLDSGKTYLLELIAKNDGDEIHYYTRVTYGTQFHLKECKDFAMEFHDATLTEGSSEFIARYMETAEGTINNNLSYVDLKSTQEAVRYAELKPQVEQMYPVSVKEISQNVTAMELRCIMSTEDSNGGKQYYQVNEYFRVRYSRSRNYLLNYERTMESYMRYDDIDRVNNRIRLGIGDSNKSLISKDGGKKISFIAENELWYYDYQQDQMCKVFSFIGEDYRDNRSNYPNHGIQVMNMDNSGDMTFLVYGYMNRGEHEGRNGISVYRYDSDSQKITELSFIPTTGTYETMKEDLEKGAYLSDSDQFYFYLDHGIYHVDLKENDSEILDKNVEDNMAIISDGGKVAISKGDHQITILDSATGKEETIKCKANEVLKPIGFVEDDFIYGVGEESLVHQKGDGSYIYPLDTVYIRSQGKNIQEYAQSGQYITEASVDGTTIALTWSTPTGNTYKKGQTRHIRYKSKKENRVVFEYGYNAKTYNQLYLAFPKNVYIQTRPNYLSVNVEEKSEDFEVKFADNHQKYTSAYVYTGGKLSGVYANMNTAIRQAKKGDGVVVGYGQAYLWEKGITQSYGKVANIPIIKAGSVEKSADACIAMIARAQGEEESYDDISKMQGDVFDKLFKVFDKGAVNYSNCKLEDVLYSISKGRPVIVKRNNGSYVLLISYNQTKLRYLDPIKGESVQGDRASLERDFRRGGNVYYSFAR